MEPILIAVEISRRLESLPEEPALRKRVGVPAARPEHPIAQYQDMKQKPRNRIRPRIKRAIWNSPFLWHLYLIARKGKGFFQHRFFLKPPLQCLVVEVTNHCNLSCIMCGNRLITRQKGFMAGKTFDATINGLPPAHLNLICMFAQGEPLLHPRLPDFFEKVHRLAKVRALSTNALPALRNPELPERLMKAGMNHLHCSGDGYDAPTYERVRINGRFEDFLKSIMLFKHARDRLNPEIVIELLYCLVEKHTREEYQQVFETYGQIVDEIVFKPLNNQANIHIPAGLQQKFFGFRYYLTEKERPCQWLWRAPTILWDGRVSACCRNYHGELIMGNVHDNSLTDIWHNRAYQTLRRDHARGHPPEDCRGCTDLHDDDMRIAVMNRRIRKQLGRPDFRLL